MYDNKAIITQIFEKIKSYDKIMIFRHFRPDGDAIGSTRGLARMLRLTFPEKRIYIQNNDQSDYLAFLGGEDALLPKEEYADALGLVLDSATTDRISCKDFSACREIVKIDHHIPVESYGDLQWVEEERSSCCEMVAAFYEALQEELVIDAEAATFVYTGMVTDSGRFRFRSVSGDTMRLAGLMLEQKIDTDRLFANLYLRDIKSLKLDGYLAKIMEVSENGVASLYISRRAMKRFGLTDEEASATVSFMDSMKGVIMWLAFIENSDGSIRVRLRSRFVTVDKLANRYHGGGHDCASGATVYSKKEAKKLIAEADAAVKAYKETHEGWL